MLLSLKEIIDLQAGRHTPYSREEIIIDYINIGTFRENYTKILLIIVTLSVVRRQLEILAKAGLSTEEVLALNEKSEAKSIKKIIEKVRRVVKLFARVVRNTTRTTKTNSVLVPL